MKLRKRLLRALNHPGKLDMNLVDAQQARRILIGWWVINFHLCFGESHASSAGRVQSVAVRLIVEREREIKAFKPVEYWEILPSFKRPPLEAKLVKLK